MEAQRSQKELNATLQGNQRHAEMMRRIDRIEKNLDIIIEMLVKEKQKKK